MSNNLVKRMNTQMQQDDVRVIDTNALIIKRIEALGIKAKQLEKQDILSSMHADKDKVNQLLEEDASEEFSSNVIKADANPESNMEDEIQKLELLKEEANQIYQDAQQQAKQLMEDTRRMLDQERHVALEEAKQQGYQDGLAKGQSEIDALKQNIVAEHKKTEEEYQKLADELEPQFIDVITDIYEHIFHIELRSYREILVYLISTTMRKIEGNNNFLIHVSKEDYPYVSMQKKQIAAGATTQSGSVEIIEDITLSKNECLIETDGGIFDCGLGTQLEELKKKLMLLSYERT